MYITRACYERIGGFDPALFMYFEDVEYSLRAREAGFRVLLVPKAIVYHHVSVSTGGSKSPNGIYYMLRNGITVLEQHYPLARPLTIMRRVVMLLAMMGFILVETTGHRPLRRCTRWLSGRLPAPSRAAAHCGSPSRHHREIVRRNSHR